MSDTHTWHYCPRSIMHGGATWEKGRLEDCDKHDKKDKRRKRVPGANTLEGHK